MTKTELQPGRTLRELLDNATGRSEFVIVVVADIRGFSEFSKSHESPDVAMYIKRVYTRLIDTYFPFGNFFKATGDGLLVTIPFDEKNLQEMARKTVKSAIACHKEFGQICDGDPMVNVTTPERIGIGIARGTACCIVSGDEIVDYSGHLLNLASRLMDLARPSGIVIDDSFGIELLTPAVAKGFKQQNVYVRSVAETEPMSVHFLRGTVEIPEEAKHPLRLEQWKTIERVGKLKDWRAPNPHDYSLEHALKRADGVAVKVSYPTRRAGKLTGGTRLHYTDAWEYVVSGSDHLIRVDNHAIFQHLRKQRAQLEDEVTMTISYIPKP